MVSVETIARATNLSRARASRDWGSDEVVGDLRVARQSAGLVAKPFAGGYTSGVVVGSGRVSVGGMAPKSRK